jgi:phage/plasmid-associated DNA primase
VRYFYCNPDTNVWAQKSSVAIEGMLLGCLRRLPRGALGAAELKHLRSKRGRAELLHTVGSVLHQEDFDLELDVNLDLFALSDRVVDMRTKRTRAIVPEDRISITAGWEYDATAARELRPDLERFLAEVFPMEVERSATIAFYAHCLSGRRSSKKLIVLTDRRGGNNGKSTLLALIQSFFGPLSVVSTDFVCRGQIARDRHAHAAGMEPMKGARLVTAEELKAHMLLDVALLKKLSGGANVLVEGRKFGSEERFSFIWQANIALVFNEGDCPSLDGDKQLVKRMMVAPCRSKFVPAVPEEPEEYTFRLDKNIDRRFAAWRSALLDIFVESYDPDALDALPPGMESWKQGIAAESNPLAEWLGENIVVTGDRADHVVYADLRVRYRDQFKGKSSCMKLADFSRHTMNYLELTATSIRKNKSRLKIEGEWETVNTAVAFGLKLTENVLDD